MREYRQIYLQTLNVKMTSLAHPLHSLASHASRLACSFAPYFFVNTHSRNELLKASRLTIKINRQMSPLFNKLPGHVRLGLWNTRPVTQNQVHQQTISNSFLLNPFKTQKIVSEALRKGVTKMLVSDIEELVNIQEAYFRLRKQGIKIKEPQYIWSVENLECDIENISTLLKCDLPLSGLCFTKEMGLHEVKNFMANKKINLDPYLKLREIQVQKFAGEIKDLESLDIQPLVTNYSETDNYRMVCRVIGNDKSGNPVLDQSCLDFICRNQTCSCEAPPLKYADRFAAGGFDWVVVQPKRLDRLKREFVVDI